ncbi:hypothetical protein POM88_027319 [Heracleum sosnowskyi]|uniref:Uncharacterized protein n=1 Tax=Heracleum sosnowskyi TaxID=360622 RepID=A0AAD8IAR6_9APIA|nr:hypothetical protein POM88_027319 [Heracleum sosnowskyi]
MEGTKSNLVKHLYGLVKILPDSVCNDSKLDADQLKLARIRSEINESDKPTNINNVIDDADLSLRKLEELHTELQALQKEKSDRLKQLQDLATSMLELWNLMDTPIEEQHMFHNVTCNVAASEHEIVEPNILFVEAISYVEAEVFRLEELKAIKMKELVFKKRSELEEICMKTHMIPESDSAMEATIDAIETGMVESLAMKTTAREKERGIEFTYDNTIKVAEFYLFGITQTLRKKIKNNCFPDFLPSEIYQ